jgi:uncharacterized BrkB/YihY/UPF0761 family membrane protein
MLDFLDFIGAIGELFASWRFYICVGIAAGVIALIYWLLPDPWRLILSIPVAVIAATLGIIWERRAW